MYDTINTAQVAQSLYNAWVHNSINRRGGAAEYSALVAFLSDRITSGLDIDEAAMLAVKFGIVPALVRHLSAENRKNVDLASN